MSKNNKNAEIWGRPLWEIMHIFAANYPEKPSTACQISAKQFYHSLRYMLPCDVCKTHYTQFIEEQPPNVDNRDELSKWVLWVHNKVNERLKKPLWTWEQLIRKYPFSNDMNGDDDADADADADTDAADSTATATATKNNVVDNAPSPQILDRLKQIESRLFKDNLSFGVIASNLNTPTLPRRKLLQLHRRGKKNFQIAAPANNRIYPITIRTTVKKTTVTKSMHNNNSSTRPRRRCGCGR